MCVNKYIMNDSLRSRLRSLLLNPKQSYFIYLSGEGGEYITSRITQMSSKYNNSTPTLSEPERNRTIVNYPKIWRWICKTVGQPGDTIDSIINLLEQDQVVDEESVGEMEEYFAQCDHALFRSHQLNLALFVQHPVYMIHNWGIWRAYTSAVATAKVECTLGTVQWVNDQWRLQPGPHYRFEQIQQYMKDHDIVTTEHIRMNVLLMSREEVAPPIDWVFTAPLPELHARYRYLTSLRDGEYSDMIMQRQREYSATLLDFKKIICEPDYLAGIMHIENPEFHRGIVNWHRANLDLLLNAGFTEFEHLRF